MKKIMKKMSGGGVLLNKVLSIVLILTILIIPFQTLLNVKAEKVVITTDETTLEGNSDFKHVTNKSKVVIGSTDEYIDEYIAYKILDIYYNETTNEMTYGFTSEFKSFIDQLPSSDDFHNLTIEGYQALTGDNSNGPANSDGVTTTSTLNKLVSKYLTFIKKTGITTDVKNLKVRNEYEAEVGAYLVIPSKVTEFLVEEGLQIFTGIIYGVSVLNLNFSVTNGEWSLHEGHVYSKVISNMQSTYLLHDSMQSEEPTISTDVVYSVSKDLYLIYMYQDMNYELPTNTHSSILNNSTIMDKIRKVEITFPIGLTYDLNEIYFSNSKATVKNNAIYITDSNGGETRIADVSENTNTNSIVLSNMVTIDDFNNFFFKLKANNNIKLGTTTNAEQLANYGNIITINAYYLKDAYVDISGMTQEEAEAAVLGGTLTNTVYTYGVKVTNKDNSTLLNGAKFQVCLDKDCNTKVGEEFEITENGTYTFKGLNDTDTYYLKQTKAASGYKVADSVELKPTSLNKETGFYDVEVTSKKMGLLPSTGGLGTILYTTFGLLIIVVGSITFISYRKRQVNN